MILIDSSKKFQTIGGFGVTVPTSSKTIYDTKFYETLINDLGCSIVCSEAESEIASAMKSIKPGLVLTRKGDSENIVSNTDSKNTWGHLMSLRAMNPVANLSDIYGYVYSKMASDDKRLIEEGSVGTLWKAVFEDKTEVSIRDTIFFSPVPSGALDLAVMIYSALIHGFCAYITGPATTVYDIESPQKTLCVGRSKTPKFQTAKHFFKYVAPGMVRIGASGGSNTLLVIAFKSDKTVVNLINSGDRIVDDQIVFSGPDNRHYTSFTSVENEYHHQEDGGIVGNRIDISLAPNSIITFVVK